MYIVRTLPDLQCAEALSNRNIIGIIEWFRLERTCKDHLVPHPTDSVICAQFTARSQDMAGGVELTDPG